MGVIVHGLVERRGRRHRMHAGSDLVRVAAALQSADLAREALVATSYAAHHMLSQSIPPAQLRPLLAHVQHDVHNSVLRWAASVQEVRR